MLGNKPHGTIKSNLGVFMTDAFVLDHSWPKMLCFSSGMFFKNNMVRTAFCILHPPGYQICPQELRKQTRSRSAPLFSI